MALGGVCDGVTGEVTPGGYGDFMSLMTLVASPVRISTMAMQRYGRRNDSTFCSNYGKYWILRLTEQLYDALESTLGNAEVFAWGTRESRGMLAFDLRSAVDVEGAATPEDTAELAQMGRELLEQYSDWCACGQPRPECDCCSACDGRGSCGPAPACVECDGEGFVDPNFPGCPF